MDSLYFLIPVALVFCAIAIRLLLWAIDNGQYDDLDKEGWRILMDEDDTRRTKDDEKHGAERKQDEGGGNDR